MWQLATLALALALTLALDGRGQRGLVAGAVSERDDALGSGPTVPAQAVLAGRARLPCSLTSDKPGDRPELVLWYRDTSGAPIYSYDARQEFTSGGVHWKDHFVLDNRNANFVVDADPPVLVIDDVIEADAGVYQCRVDFKRSPTKYSKVNLTVIVPPQVPTVWLPSGEEVREVLGPLTEGDRVQLICKTRGGRPAPMLSWWQGAELLTNSFTVTPSGDLRSTLTLPAISRHHVDQAVSCQANNNNISAPRSRTITLQTYFRPLYVRLEGRNRPLSAGRVHYVTCKTAGSRPQPQVTWWLGELQLKEHNIQTSLDGNETTSVLLLNASREMNHKHLICRSDNPLLANSVLEDAWRITVHYPPEVSLRLGRLIEPGMLKQGDDAYFDCLVKANPWIYKIEWLHDGEVLSQSYRDGVVMTNTSLVLQNLSRRRTGSYVCRVANTEGENVSNPIQLSIQHAPVCRANQRREYHVPYGEEVKVTCLVDATPGAMMFQWRLNNSVDITDLPPDRFRSTGSSSELTLRPTSEGDYGTLECLSVNEIGDQAAPCRFTLLPAVVPVVPPPAPIGCHIGNRTSATLSISCLPSSPPDSDTSIPTSTSTSAASAAVLFQLEVYQTKTGRLLANLTARPVPEFVVGDLAPGEEVLVHVFRVSGQLRSQPTTLEAGTLKVAELKTRQDAADDGMRFTPLVGILLGALGALLLIVIAVVLTLRRVRSREPPPPYIETEDSREKMLGIGPPEEDSVSEKSPDVVPCKLLDRRKGGSHSQEVRKQPAAVVPSMPSISETVETAPNSSLPRRQHTTTTLDYHDPRIGPGGGMQTFHSSSGLDIYPSRLSDLPGFPRAPARPSDIQLSFDSSEMSETGSDEHNRSWQESVV